jgi:hypothetical protein
VTKGTRYFILGALATMGVGLTAGLVAYYSGFPLGALAQSESRVELQYVPRDAALVAYANVRDVMASDLRRRLRDVGPDGRTRAQEEFERRTGINIETDLERVVACVMPPAGDPSDDAALVLARGRFDFARLEALAREHGGSIAEYKGRRIVTHRGDAADRPMAMGFIEAGLIALGSDRLVRQAIDLAGGGENVTSNAELMRLVDEIDEGNAWAVGRFDALTESGRLPEAVIGKLPPITWFSASGTVNGGVRGMVRAEAKDEAAAQNLRDVVRGFMALVKMQAGAQPAADAVVKSLELGGTGRSVSLSFTVPSEVIEAAAKPAPSR